MRRTKLLQERRKIRLEETFEGRATRRPTREGAAHFLGMSGHFHQFYRDPQYGDRRYT